MRLQREEIGTAPGPNAANDPARYGVEVPIITDGFTGQPRT